MFKQEGNILIILALVTAIFAGGIIYLGANSKNNPINLNNYKPNPTTYFQPSSTSSAEQIGTYQSQSLKFIVNLSNKFKAQEKFTTTAFESAEGEIRLSRIGTNFNSLDTYLKDLMDKNKLIVKNRSKTMINGMESTQVETEDPNSPTKIQKVYYIYVDGWVYSLSTSSESLYDELDQIAKSFRYVP